MTKIKQLWFILIILVMCIPSSYTQASNTIRIDGQVIPFNDESGYPFIGKNSRTQVPLRATLETFGAEAYWNGESQTATCIKDNTRVEVPISKSYILNGNKKLNDSQDIHPTVKDTPYAIAAGLSDYQRAATYYWRDMADIYVSTDALIGLEKDGTVISIGRNYDGQLDVEAWQNIKTIDTGYKFTVGLKKDGTVVATGNNEYGQCNVGSWKNIKKILVDDDFTLGLTYDGKVLGVGHNDHGQCNTMHWEMIDDIYIGEDNVYGLKTDGTVVAVGKNNYGQCNVSEWQQIVALSCGDDHVVGLKSNGTVVAIGLDDEKEIIGLSQSGPKYSTSRLQVDEWKDIVKVAAGSTFTVGLKKNGDVWVTGASFKHNLRLVDKRYNLYGSPWNHIVDIDIYKGDGIIGLDKNGNVFRVIDNGVISKIDVPDFETQVETVYSKYESMLFDVSLMKNIESIRVEKELIIGKSNQVSDKLVYLGEPRNLEASDAKFLERLGDFYSPEILTNVDKNYYYTFFGAYGRNNNRFKSDKLDRIIVRKPSEEVLNLALDITEGIQDDYDKVIAVHDWVCTNMYYDIDYYYNNAPLTITKLGEDEKLIGVCQDYSSLTSKLLNAINIPCSFETGMSNGFGKWEPHAWNNVYVNGKWITIDVTWDSNNDYSSLDDKYYAGEVKYTYFDMSIEEYSKNRKYF